jgi:hypothetical protein
VGWDQSSVPGHLLDLAGYDLLTARPMLRERQESMNARTSLWGDRLSGNKKHIDRKQ